MSKGNARIDDGVGVSCIDFYDFTHRAMEPLLRGAGPPYLFQILVRFQHSDETRGFSLLKTCTGR
jgi:hypothetical protein